jgi:hypothetical protein
MPARRLFHPEAAGGSDSRLAGLAFRSLAATKRLRDDRIAEHQSRFSDVLET